MKKLLILTNEIPQYRIEVYNKLSKLYNLTVAHYNKKNYNLIFNTIRLSPIYIGPFTFFKESIWKLSQNFDSLLVMGKLQVIPYNTLVFNFKRKFSLTYWGMDVSASYEKGYDIDRKYDFIRFYLMKKADSLVFYSEYPVKRYINDGNFDRKTLFVANNTVYIDKKKIISKNKKNFLFIGTLYPGKKIFNLLKSYKVANLEDNNLRHLNIVGDGPEKTKIIKWINEHNLSNKIHVLGAIYDKDKLSNIFSDSIACISPGQAGLSVLNSIGHGVPFITSKNAITAGEIFNVINNKNGYLYDGSIKELKKIIIRLSQDEKLVNKLSINAQNYYYKHASFKNMVMNLDKSIKYGLSIIK